MAADNDLWDVALVDLEEIKQGYRETGVNLIVLMDVIDKTTSFLLLKFFDTISKLGKEP
jgi:hypothetical protein